MSCILQVYAAHAEWVTKAHYTGGLKLYLVLPHGGL